MCGGVEGRNWNRTWENFWRAWILSCHACGNGFTSVCVCVCVCVCSVMSNSLQPHGLHYEILQASILEWVAFPFSKRSSQPRDWTQVSHIAGGFFINWATREAQIHGSEHYFLNQLASTIWAKSPPYISLVFTTVPSRAVGIWKAFSKCL